MEATLIWQLCMVLYHIDSTVVKVIAGVEEVKCLVCCTCTILVHPTIRIHPYLYGNCTQNMDYRNAIINNYRSGYYLEKMFLSVLFLVLLQASGGYL